MNGSETETASNRIPQQNYTLLPSSAEHSQPPCPFTPQPLPGKRGLHTQLKPGSAFNKLGSSLCEFH